MSKSNSEHFSGTGAAQLSRYALGTHSKVTKPSIRNYRSESMGVIKSEIESNDFVFVCDFTDTPSLKRMLKCYDELTDIGCVLTIQEQTRMIPREILINLLQMHKEIQEETQAAIDAEIGDDEDDDI